MEIDPYFENPNDKFIYLVNIINEKSSKNQRVDEYFNEIVKLLYTRIHQVIYNFNIIGLDKDDLYQEALITLRYSAIKDYDETKGTNGPYPFEKFAILCITRSFMTKMKATYQQKRKALNFSISLDQNVSDTGSDFDGILSLMDIVPSRGHEDIDNYMVKDTYKQICREIFNKLSKFEQKVFLLYLQRYSYDDMAYILNKNSIKSKKLDVKSIDNALVRIKMKAHETIEKFKDC